MYNSFSKQPPSTSSPQFSSWKRFSTKTSEIGHKYETRSSLQLNNIPPENALTRSIAWKVRTNRCLLDKSFEANQSFPKICRKNADPNLSSAVRPNQTDQKPKIKMDKIRVDGFNGLRFTPIRKKGCFTPNTGSPYSGSFLNPKSSINPNKAVFTIDSKTSVILIVNKNACELLGYTSRELCDSKFSNLLACKNKIHVSALAENQFNSEDGTMILLSGKVVEMIHKNSHRIPVSLWIRQIDNEGRCLAVAEPVERRVAQLIIDKNGFVISGDYEALMLFQLESLDKFVGLDVTVLIPAIQLPDSDAQVIPKLIRKQRATGKTQDGVAFPLCLMITHQDNSCETTDSTMTSVPSNLLFVTIWVYSNLSGLIVIDENSIIESCNHHFSTLMFGYPQTKIVGQNIFKLIPNFGQEFEYIDTRNRRSPSLENEESETETDHILLNDPFIPIGIQSPMVKKDNFKICLDFTSPRNSIRSSDSEILKNGTSDIVKYNENDKNIMNHVNGPNSEDYGNVSKDGSDEHELLTPVNETGGTLNDDQDEIIQESSNRLIDGAPKTLPPPASASMPIITSTPDIRKRSSAGLVVDFKQSPSQNHPINVQHFDYNYVNGKYKGEALHADGNVIDIVYTIYKHTLSSNQQTIYLVWICRDPDSEYNEEEDEEKQFNLTLTLNSLTSTIETSAGPQLKNNASSACISNTTSSLMMTSATAGNTLANITSASRPTSLSIMSQCEDEQISGEYSKHYTTLKQIGKGAYGYVKMAYRNSDRLLVISKFILKEKLCSTFMIMTDDKKEIPMEIYLLKRVKHPNIVSVLDVFENEKFFQMIMEKHGSGMDLFEFIDRRPLIDEKLGCYIFRQIARAVDYLHSLTILHRDIKDENIIIDQNFHIKLIDFGSATFMNEGKMFSTFYGTTEYCSPEVLAGNKYKGPELEMWSLGVTLFVLMFFENPFMDMEDTLRADLVIPQDVSVELENVLMRMLEKNPNERLSMKELLAHEWITQEIVNNFNFAWIVPCEPHESNPDVYYSGQAYSSATALSTSHDSLSMADDESMDDPDDTDNIKLIDFDDHIEVSTVKKVHQTFNDLQIADDLATQKCTNRSKTGKTPSELCTTHLQQLVQPLAQQPVDVTKLKFQHHDDGLLVSPFESNRSNVMITKCSDKSPVNSHCCVPLTIAAVSMLSASSCQLTSSKSENNIFDRHLPLSSFDVVSMSNLTDSSYQDEHYQQMNDLSRIQVLNRLSESDDRLGDGKLNPY